MNNIELKYLLGKRIEELRIRKGLTQQQVADRMNIDQRTFSRIENGKNFPLRNLPNLAEALEVDLPALFDFNHIELTSFEMREFIKYEIDNISDDNIKIIYRLLVSLCK